VGGVSLEGVKGFLGFLLAAGAVGGGVYLLRGGKLPGLSGSRRCRSHLRGESEQNELTLYIDNDADLYRQQMTPIHKNLATKLAKGIYDRAKAEKLWMYLVENGAKKYNREFGNERDLPWHKMFSMEDRRAIAKDFNDQFLEEWKNGSYDKLLPKKYARAPGR
jgi:hypothetical protein